MEPLEPRLLLSGSWGAGAQGPAEAVAAADTEGNAQATNMALHPSEDKAVNRDGLVDLLAVDFHSGRQAFEDRGQARTVGLATGEQSDFSHE